MRKRLQEQLKTKKDNYKRNRDLLYIVSGAIYAIQIIDATVFAHFYDFEINDDLSMNLRPSTGFSPVSGGNCGFDINFLIFKGISMRFVFLWLCAILFSGVVYGESDRDSLKVRLGAPLIEFRIPVLLTDSIREPFIERLDELYSKWYVTRLGEGGLRGFGLSDRNGDRAICA